MNQKIAYLLGPEDIEIRSEEIAAPGHGEILLRIEAATTCGTDVKVFRRGGHPRMLQVPTPFGHEVAGRVESLGEGVRKFELADRVVVANSAPCGSCDYCEVGRENLCRDLIYLNGAFAEFLLVPERFVTRNTHLIPESVPGEVAALTEPLACVLHGIEACGLDAPADVLVCGAGPIGLLFVAALSSEGHRVTIADPHPSRRGVANQLGAANALAIERGGKQAEVLREASPSGEGYACVIDATGVPAVWQDAIDSARIGGVINLFGGCAPGTSIPLDTHRIHYDELTIKGVYHHRPATMRAALDLLALPGFDVRCLLSCELPLARLEDALRLMMSKKALKVVIRGAESR